MGGATNRFFTLLSSSSAAPIPLLLHHHHRSPGLLRLSRRPKLPLLSSSLSSFCGRRHYLTISPFSPSSSFVRKASQHFHSHAGTSSLSETHSSNSASATVSSSSLASASWASHPWPEWSSLVNSLSASGYLNRNLGIVRNDEFVGVEGLPEDFALAARACLAFARERASLVRLLSRRDVEVVVENGTPFLFNDADGSATRLGSFPSDSQTNVLDSDKVQTVDLMRFILSYASNPIFPSKSNNYNNRELVEPSVRNLLSELAKLCYCAPESRSFGSGPSQFPDRNGRTLRPLGQNIEMKRGDWICPRNMKCLECEEARPKRQLTGGEWECPQCDFFNYGRNTVCLRCDCKRPGGASFASARLDMAYENGNNATIENRLAANEEKAQRWFSKISQLDNTEGLSSADEDFPEIMPLRKGVNRFVVSTRKTPLERRLTNSQYQSNLGNDGTSKMSSETESLNHLLGTAEQQSQNEISINKFGSGSNNKGVTGGQNVGTESSSSFFNSASPRYGPARGNSSSYVPFVPLPADMFAKKPNAEESGEAVTGTDESAASKTSSLTGKVFRSNECAKPGESADQAQSNDKEKEQAEKSERWFKRVAELHNVTDLAGAISDDDFPEIMPMRKGENRFVVSKKKDRSLTSPAYKRRMATEQGNKTNFVPFVPFPPDYFSKDKPQPDGKADLSNEAVDETTSSSNTPEKLPEKLDDARWKELSNERVQQMEKSKSWSLEPSRENLNENKTGFINEPSSSGKSSPKFAESNSRSKDDSSNVYFKNETSDNAPNVTGSLPPLSENQNIRESWTAKSLEGSAVKEPDPLDMSEEAKAERWFRRVAQIKDISELSQIPDEDFPSIMPMRKGVNRFVVSKRKTPLERRLTSPQYRRNLPIVSSDPTKGETDGS
ncbi:zinc finger protein VAR3, chloroplastic isoform X2 [Ziziphus jujuba]|uniref:Zinc finger protein VAR3, chloroplastic isoform X2 n=1 Tax=Ziziphus jujuba TaxID=326968 RepID=A0A6P6FPP5_ZIZJJ|nr:zinc finger protein VAR3, chloroplastic isoform X2 [Ziziphus jujuba]